MPEKRMPGRRKPDKRRVTVTLHSVQTGGADMRLICPGELYRTLSGWVLAYTEPAYVEENGPNNRAGNGTGNGSGDGPGGGQSGETREASGATSAAGGPDTVSTLFVRDGELKLRRRGAIVYEQTFRAGAAVAGYMETPYGPHAMEAATERIDVALTNSGGYIEWNYSLRMQGQEAGQFHLRLDVREES